MQTTSAPDGLARLRHNLADDAFLLEHVYTRENSKFLGGTTRYLVCVQLPEDRNAVEALLLTQLPSGLRGSTEAKRVIAQYVRLLPTEIATRIELPAEIDAAESVQACLERGRVAIAHSLRAKTPYAWLFSSIRRIQARFGQPARSADACEAQALLESYHDWGVRRARLRFPEIWDTTRGHYIFDSRGVPFGREMIRELQLRGMLAATHRFLDIGSGIGTLVASVALWSEASASGIELHAGLSRFGGSLVRRLTHKGALDVRRVHMHQGDALSAADIDLGQFDVLYLYSPLGKQEIEVDPVVARMRGGALLVSAHLPTNNLDMVSLEPRLTDLFAMRRRA